MAGCAFGYPLRTADYKEDFHLKSCSQEFSQLKRCGFFFFTISYTRVSNFYLVTFFCAHFRVILINLIIYREIFCNFAFDCALSSKT